MVSIPACHAGDRGSIPRQREDFFIIIIFSFGDWPQGRIAKGGFFSESAILFFRSPNLKKKKNPENYP